MHISEQFPFISQVLRFYCLLNPLNLPFLLRAVEETLLVVCKGVHKSKLTLCDFSFKDSSAALKSFGKNKQKMVSFLRSLRDHIKCVL